MKYAIHGKLFTFGAQKVGYMHAWETPKLRQATPCYDARLALGGGHFQKKCDVIRGEINKKLICNYVTKQSACKSNN